MQVVAMLPFLGYYTRYALVFIDRTYIWRFFFLFVNIYFGSLIFLLKCKLEMSMVYLFGLL